MKYFILIFTLLLSLGLATTGLGHGWHYTSDFTKCIDASDEAEIVCMATAVSTVDFNDCWYADEARLLACARDVVDKEGGWPVPVWDDHHRIRNSK